MQLIYKHGIAVTEEAVFFSDSFFITAHDFIFARKGADQHQQCRLRQMEVGYQGIDRLERVTGIDKDIRLAGKRP